MATLKSHFQKLIEEAVVLGLKDAYITEAQEYLAHQEYALCLDTIISRLHEYDVHISLDYYHLIEKIAKSIHLPEDEYEFAKVLIKM